MNTDWKSLQINGRAPREGEPNAEEYTRRFVAWVQQERAAGRITTGRLPTEEERADYAATR